MEGKLNLMEKVKGSLFVGKATIRFVVILMLLAVPLLFGTSFRGDNTKNSVLTEVFVQMQNTIKSMKTVKYSLKNTERIGSEYMKGYQHILSSAVPKKSYVKFVEPSEGAELLFVEGENDNNAVYNPNGFPYFKLKLDPYGSLMRRNNHHTIHEIGFRYIGDLLSFYFNKNAASFNIVGEETWEGILCWKVIVNDPNFGFKDYVVGKNESTVSLANKYYINEYLILERNDHVSSFGDLDEGVRIKIPNSYAKSIVLMIEKETSLPLFIKISDDKGLLESYKYYNIQMNPRVSETDFSFKNLKFSF